jgi:hypothetical protein
MARRVLDRSPDARMAAAVKRANDFLLQTPMLNVMNASAVLMAFGRATDAQGTKRAQVSLPVIPCPASQARRQHLFRSTRAVMRTCL